MTTYPRWMNGPTVKKETYVSTAIWLNTGILLFEAGIFYSLSLAAIGLGIFLFSDLNFVLHWIEILRWKGLDGMVCIRKARAPPS